MLWYPSDIERGAFWYPCNIFQKKTTDAGLDFCVTQGLVCGGHPWEKGASWNLTPPPATTALPHIRHTLEVAHALPSARTCARTKMAIFTTVVLFSTRMVLYYIEVRHRLSCPANPPRDHAHCQCGHLSLGVRILRKPTPPCGGGGRP